MYGSYIRDDLANIQLWDCNGTGAQIWQLLDGGAGSFFLKNVNSGRCADVDAWKQDSGANIIQFECRNTPNQGVYLPHSWIGLRGFEPGRS